MIAELRVVADPSRLPGMARVGINVDRALGVSIPDAQEDRTASPTRSLAGSGSLAERHPRSPHPGLDGRRPRGGDAGSDGGVGRRLRFVGSLRSGDLEPLRSDAVRGFRRSRVDEAARGVREARGVRDDRGARRPRPDGSRSHVHGVVPGDPPRCDGRSQLREEGRELGAPPDRQAEPASSTRRPSRRRRCWRHPISPARVGSVAMRCASCGRTRPSGACCPASGRRRADHGLGLQLHLPSRIQQSGHHHHGRGRPDVAEHLAVHASDLRPVLRIDQVGPRPHDVLASGAERPERIEHDLEAASHLDGDVRVDVAAGPDGRGAGDQDPVSGTHRPAESDRRLEGRTRRDAFQRLARSSS